MPLETFIKWDERYEGKTFFLEGIMFFERTLVFWEGIVIFLSF